MARSGLRSTYEKWREAPTRFFSRREMTAVSGDADAEADARLSMGARIRDEAAPARLRQRARGAGDRRPAAASGQVSFFVFDFRSDALPLYVMLFPEVSTRILNFSEKSVFSRAVE